MEDRQILNLVRFFMVKVRMRWFANIIARFLPQLFVPQNKRSAAEHDASWIPARIALKDTLIYFCFLLALVPARDNCLVSTKIWGMSAFGK